jgi:hypothetical protein
MILTVADFVRVLLCVVIYSVLLEPSRPFATNRFSPSLDPEGEGSGVGQ